MLPWPMWPKITLASGYSAASSSTDHGSREDRVPGVHQRRQAARGNDLHQRPQRRVVGVVAVDQRMHLDADERGVVEQLDRGARCCRARAGGPDAGPCAPEIESTQLLTAGVVGREHAALGEASLRHQRYEPVAVERDVNPRVEPDVRVLKSKITGGSWVSVCAPLIVEPDPCPPRPAPARIAWRMGAPAQRGDRFPDQMGR